MPHQGTFNANPVSAAAGIATLEQVRTGAPSETANKSAARLRKGMNEVIDSLRLNWCVYGTFSEFRYLIGHDLGDVRAAEIDPSVIAYTKLKGVVNPALVQNLRCGLLLHGVDTPAHGGLTMAAHSEKDIDQTILAFEKTLHTMKRSELL
jgi:glutamate-1-semialdehyde 2,1-aminomutase